MSVAGVGPDAQYTVFLDGSLRTFFAEQIEPCEARTTNWVSREVFRTYLTASLINTPSAQNLYSLNSARIDYVPYQFRPVLKIVKADEPRILIADSVGVGKTIEAGLIVKELEAHSPLERIAIICPKPLVAEKKWEDEMRDKFDEDFVPLDGAALRQALNDADRDGRWPDNLSRVIIPYSIMDEMTLRGNKESVGKKSRGRIYGLEDVIKSLHFNLVIVDEAHHIRNGSDLADKAYAYKCTKIFCDRADAVVMLTATPLQNKTHDLFTLLNVLRPDLIIDEQVFDMMAEPNPFITHISHLARVQGDGWRKLALEDLVRVAETGWGKANIVKNPDYAKCRARLLQPDELSREERVAFITDIEGLHSFNSMINRTRRRDIDAKEFCVRAPKTIEIPFTKPQNDLHEALLTFEHRALAALHGEHCVQFMMTTVKRQAASCIFGLAPFLKMILDRRLRQIENATAENSDQEIDLSAGAIDVLKDLAQNVLSLAANLPPDDPKFESALAVIREKMTHEKNKIMLFSAFRHTLAYIKGKLTACGIRVGQIDGDVADADRRELRARFMLPKSDPDALDVLLFTEVGSEGLDYQFCDMMINYDLPWNPMAVEQRIGRIDRRMQKSEKVFIINMVTPGTVDADVYNRCLTKLGVFKESIGDCEEILGDVEKDIRNIVLDEKLTDAQRQQKLEQLADNVERMKQAELALEEEQKSLFGLDIANLKDSTAIEQARSPWLSPECLQGLIAFYFNSRIGGGSYFLGNGVKKTLRLGRQAKDALLDDLRNSSLPKNSQYRHWQAYLKGDDQTRAVTFDGSCAHENPDAFFFTPVHPLVKVAASYFEHHQNVTEPCIAFRASVPGIVPGRYPFAVYTWNSVGFSTQFKMEIVPLDEKLGSALPSIVQDAQCFELSGDASDCWKDIEPVHMKLWRRAKDELMTETHKAEQYKLQTALLSYSRKKTLIEKRMNTNADPRLDLMFKSQLANEQERYDARTAKIRETAARADIVFRKIANGVIEVEAGV